MRQNLASNGDIVLPTVRSDRKTPEERLARYRRGLGDAGVGLLAKLLAWDLRTGVASTTLTSVDMSFNQLTGHSQNDFSGLQHRQQHLW